jgi:hypothetical protein
MNYCTKDTQRSRSGQDISNGYRTPFRTYSKEMKVYSGKVSSWCGSARVVPQYRDCRLLCGPLHSPLFSLKMVVILVLFVKAFFYAGSRALLVSHWPVGSDAAIALTTRMLAAAKAGLTRAEAHRQAMMAMIDTGHTPHCGRRSSSVVNGGSD